MRIFKKMKSGSDTIMFVFPHAGSGPLQYKTLAAVLPEEWELQVVHLPGREDKFSVPFILNWTEVIKNVVTEMSSLIGSFKNVVVFGHSMGAWLAFESTLEMEVKLKETNFLFIASGIKPPIEKTILTDLATKVPDGEFLQKLSGIKGIPEELKRNKEFLQAYLDVIRADLKLLLDAKIYKNKKIDFDIMALMGNSDPIVDFDSICQWKKIFTGEFKLVCLNGGHFSTIQKVDKWFPVAEELLKKSS